MLTTPVPQDLAEVVDYILDPAAEFVRDGLVPALLVYDGPGVWLRPELLAVAQGRVRFFYKCPLVR